MFQNCELQKNHKKKQQGNPERMSVLGKRRRNQTELDNKEQVHPPKKRVKHHNDSNHNKNDGKMEVDTEEKSTEIVNVNVESDETDGSVNNKKKVPSFSIQVVVNNEFKSITDQNLEGTFPLFLYFFACIFL